MTTQSMISIALKRERVNKHTVRYTQRDCTESVTAPCPSVTLPTATVEQLGLGEADDLHVRLYSSERAAAPVQAARQSEATRKRLGVTDLSEVSPIYEQLLAETSSELSRHIAEEVERQALAHERGLRLAALTGVTQPPIPLDVPELVANEVHDCSCGADGVTHPDKVESTYEGAQESDD